MGRLLPTVVLCLWLMPSLHAQQVVFSHRVYAARSASYQQLWIWSADVGHLTQISHTARHHINPSCEADGRHILFDVVDDVREPTRWRLNRMTGVEQPLAELGSRVNGAPRDAHVAWAPAECDADTARVSPDGTRVACAAKGVDILIADTRAHSTVARVPFGQHYSTGQPYPPWPMESIWSPDGRTVLIGNYGENGGSSTGEMDYFLLALEHTTWTRAFTGVDALWVTPTLIVYVTPRGLSPLTANDRHSVWTAHLTAFDPVARTVRSITSGLSNDLTPAVCPQR